MLKDDLARIVYNHIYFAFESDEDGRDMAKRLAQTIINRLEIDEREIEREIWINLSVSRETARRVAKAIAKTKPIKIGAGK